MAEPARLPSEEGAPPRRFAARHNLLLRVMSALVLAPLAVAVAWQGGIVFVLFWAAAALIVWWEWAALATRPAAPLVLATGAGALAVALALVASGRFLLALLVVALGAGAVRVVAPSGLGGWTAAGVIYAGVLVIAPSMLRFDAALGFIAILFLFAVVWLTDIAAYFAGRGIGGPRLAPRISPAKTWSGAVAGALAGVAAGVAFAVAFGTAPAHYLAAVALVLSVASQAGDLFESAVKRRFGAKDSSQLIPGHGGLMDRLDGFIAAAAVAALYGAIRAGWEAPAQGLMQW